VLLHRIVIVPLVGERVRDALADVLDDALALP
jgi:hypothetical protein